MQAAPAHPRVSVSGLCFPELSAVDTLETIAGLGVTRASLTSAKVRGAGADAVATAARRLGISMVSTTGALGLDLRAGVDLPPQLAIIKEDVDNAAAIGATVVYGLTGRRQGPDWCTAAEAYAEAISGLVDYAAERGVTLAVEPCNWLYADFNFVHSFHDALWLARRGRMGVCLDLFHVWTEGSLREDLNKNIDTVAHVQLSDMVLGDRSFPCRAVPGEGDVPLANLVMWLVEDGYDGVFECELNGPRIDSIGPVDAAQRSVAWLVDELEVLGA